MQNLSLSQSFCVCHFQIFFFFSFCLPKKKLEFFVQIYDTSIPFNSLVRWSSCICPFFFLSQIASITALQQQSSLSSPSTSSLLSPSPELHQHHHPHQHYDEQHRQQNNNKNSSIFSGHILSLSTGRVKNFLISWKIQFSSGYLTDNSM